MHSDAAGKLIYRGFKLHGENGFPHKIRGAVPDDMHAENLPMLSVRNHLHRPFHFTAKHRQPIDRVRKAPDFDLQALLLGLLLGKPTAPISGKVQRPRGINWKG